MRRSVDMTQANIISNTVTRTFMLKTGEPTLFSSVELECVCVCVCVRWGQTRVSWCQKPDGMRLSILSAKKPNGAKRVLKNCEGERERRERREGERGEKERRERKREGREREKGRRGRKREERERKRERE